MYVLEVIPLSRTAPPAPLSYRSTAKHPPGTLVSIPLRKKTMPGLVVDCVPVHEAKYALKSASFSLSKSADVIRGTLPDAIIKAAGAIATYHATTIGAVLSALLLPVLSEEIPEKFTRGTIGPDSSEESFDQTIDRIEAPFITRRARYETYLNTGTGVTLLVVPTQAEADDWADQLKAHRPLVLSGKLTAKRREAALAEACSPAFSSSFSTRLIITTPGFVWTPIISLERIIIERMSAGSYTLPKRPYLDLRYALTELARARGIALAYGDYPLPLEYRPQPDAPLSETAPGTIEILDTRKPKDAPLSAKGESEIAKKAWQAVPDILRKEIKECVDTGGRIAVLAVRRGYAPTVVCEDCGTGVADEYGRALSLATIKGVRVFRSSDGKVVESTEAFCKVCGGWNLKPLGIGIDLVEEELKAAFPDARIVPISEDIRKNASLKKIRADIAAPGTIIIGTELMLPCLSPDARVELGIIVSADSLLALPFWRSRERFVRIGRMLAERSERTIVATRRPEDAALSALSDSGEFWKEETGLRKILSYPPFGTLIVFHTEGTAAKNTEARESIRSACLPFVPHELPDRSISATTFHTSLVLQLKDGVWPDRALSERLARLSPQIRIHIDSEVLW